MSEPGNPATVSRVGVYALIGQDDRLLLIEHTDHDTLPGGAVRAGEPVEQALRRMLLIQLNATVSELDFCAVIEHRTTNLDDPPMSEVAFLFDVTLNDRPALAEPALQSYRWADEHHLSALRPTAVRNELIAGTLTVDNPWRAWTP
jgi:ADP-ribose pyrophosphatase YjhB (NUDIX family)